MTQVDRPASNVVVNERFPDAAADLTTERILAAARSEILEFGIRRMNMMDVARRAGCGRRTLYTRFSDKEQLVSTVLWGEVQAAANRMVTDVALAGSSADVVEELLVAAVRTIREHPLVNRLTGSEPEYLIDLAKNGAIAGARQLVQSYLASLPHFAGDRAVAADMIARIVLMSAIARNGVVDLGDDDNVRTFAREYLVPIATGAARPRITASRSTPALPWFPSAAAHELGDSVTERILDVAFDEFAKVGVQQANMVDIARRAACPRTTLYRRFPDKDQLVARSRESHNRSITRSRIRTPRPMQWSSSPSRCTAYFANIPFYARWSQSTPSRSSRRCGTAMYSCSPDCSSVTTC